MNSYLTAKNKRGNAGNIAILLGMGFLTGICASVALDFFLNGNNGTGMAGLVLTALSLWPVLCALKRILRKRWARQFANCFMGLYDERLTFSKLQSLLPMRNLVQKLQRLIEKGYLQNVRLDLAANGVVLSAPNRHVEENRYIEMECPSCGAKNTVLRGRIGRCAFCDQPLLGNVPQK